MLIAPLLWSLYVCAAFSALGCEPTGGGPSEPEPDAWVEIKGQRVAVDLALSASEQSLGLGRRDALPWNHGMLFLYYDRPNFYAFWMKEMRFDIDIIWIRDGRIVDIAHRVPHVPGENGPTVRPAEIVDSVLEVPAGYAQSHGWRVGNRVLVERTDGS